ncbi:putative ribonuclease h protein, partial [Nicotiana attenuata]
MAGRTTLIKATLATIPNHVMQIYDLPKTTLNKIESIQRNFLWGSTEEKKKCHLIKWSIVTMPKKQGGLGIPNTHWKNSSFNAALAWRYRKEKEDLWAKTIFSKYNHRKSKNIGFHTWKVIRKGSEICNINTKWLVGDGTTISLWHDKWINQLGALRDYIQGPIPVGELDLKLSWAIKNGIFDLRNLSFELPPYIVSKINYTYIKQTRPTSDSYTWDSKGHNYFSVKAAYEAISEVIGNGKNLAWLWKINSQNKLKYFLWIIFWDRLPTKHMLTKRGICHEDTCNICNRETEDIDHIFFRCNYSRQIWEQTNIKHPFSQDPLGKETLHNCLKNQLMSRKSFNNHLRWSDLLPFLLWHIWNFRNGILFRGIKTPITISQPISKAMEFLYMAKNLCLKPPKKTILVKWEPPNPSFYKLNIDGSCVGNPGVGGIGGVFRDDRGRWILGFNMGFDHATNIYMGILALLHGVKLVLTEKLFPLVIETDCLELLNLLKSNNCLYQNLIDDCRYLLRKANDPQLNHVFREANGVADLLAK